MRYDPLRPPDAEQWLDLGEMERMDLVADYHRCARIKLPNPRLHATLHVIVENQIFLADETPVAARSSASWPRVSIAMMPSMPSPRCSRASMFDTIKSTARGDLNSDYFRGVSELTAERWRARSD